MHLEGHRRYDNMLVSQAGYENRLGVVKVPEVLIFFLLFLFFCSK